MPAWSAYRVVAQPVDSCIILAPSLLIVILIVSGGFGVRSPVIGIPAFRSGHEMADYAMRRIYCDAIASAGGVPILIPPLRIDLLRTSYRLLDGLLLAGGGDVAGEHYGNPDAAHLRQVDTVRDGLEITLTRWALSEGLPLLGICRGIQLLNVAAGGTLVQDIPSQVPSALMHAADPSLPRDHIQHLVDVKPASLLAAILSEASHTNDARSLASAGVYGVNSYHHQAVEQPAPSFVATAHAPDGVIEGIEAASQSCFTLGVQWHPECMVPDDAAMERLFRGFVGACRQRANTCQRREVYDEASGCAE